MSLDLAQKAPEFTNLKGVDGKSHSLSDYSHKVLVVLFSCNHCPYVKAYEDRYKSIQEDYLDKDVKVIAINANDAVKYPEDSFEKMIERSKKLEFNFDYLYDEDQSVAKAFGASNTPHAFVLDQDRNLRYVGRIDDNWEDESRVKVHDLRNAIDALLEDQEPPVTSTLPVRCSVKWK